MKWSVGTKIGAGDGKHQASVQNVSGTKQTEVAAQSLHELGQKLSDMIGGRAA